MNEARVPGFPASYLHITLSFQHRHLLPTPTPKATPSEPSILRTFATKYREVTKLIHPLMNSGFSPCLFLSPSSQSYSFSPPKIPFSAPKNSKNHIKPRVTISDLFIQKGSINLLKLILKPYTALYLHFNPLFPPSPYSGNNRSI